MKISLNWLKQYIDIDLNPDELSVVLTDLGLEVEGMEQIETVKGGLTGIVAGHVTECIKHPNADKLTLTKVDVGTGEDLQIVCGAPNVAQGQKVWIATSGTTLYTPEGESWKIKSGKIRGEISEGMICAEDEIGLGNSHDGIMVLNGDVEIGTKARDHYKVETDVIYDIGLTPNRSDATSHIGVAKDLAAYFRIKKEQPWDVKMPDLGEFHSDNHNHEIKVSVENSDACPRYSGVVLSNLQIKESPLWLQNRLKAVDVRPINNIVDITNFVLHEYGQPLHAFDYDKIGGNEIIVKTLDDGTIFKSLDEIDRKLSSEDLLICDGKSNPMCIGGVFGGIDSGVTDDTKTIFLESAHFNAISIRKSSTRHLLRTDAARCFEKGSDPNITVEALKRAALLMHELAGAEISSEVTDIYPNKIKRTEIEVKYSHVNRLIGEEIKPELVHQILEAMEMEIFNKSDDHFKVKVPTNKADVLREADIIEEILRIYGLNTVAISDQIRSSVSYTSKPDKREIITKTAEFLASNGFLEMMAMSLSQSRYYSEVIPREKSGLIFVNNTSNIHLDIMRPDMLLSALETVAHNQNRQNSDVKLFEIGSSYEQVEGEIVEKEHLTLTMTGQYTTTSWKEENKKYDIYSLKGSVDAVFQKLGINKFQISESENPFFDFGLKYHRGQKLLAEFGKVKKAVSSKMDIRNDVLYADLLLKEVVLAIPKEEQLIEDISKFPRMKRDLAIVLNEGTAYQEILTLIRKSDKKMIRDISLFDVYKNEEILGKGKKSYAISLIFEDQNKTLKDKEVDQLMNKIIASLETKLEAQIRQ
jgi:phenylalanyl-tRNA synthetase beta chain